MIWYEKARSFYIREPKRFMREANRKPLIFSNLVTMLIFDKELRAYNNKLWC